MGYAYVHSECVGCGKMISYHADHVPSLTVDGERCAICKDCFDEWNQIHRVDHGLEPKVLHPKAYEPMEGM